MNAKEAARFTGLSCGVTEVELFKGHLHTSTALSLVSATIYIFPDGSDFHKYHKLSSFASRTPGSYLCRDPEQRYQLYKSWMGV